MRDFKSLTDEQLMLGIAKGGMDELGELVQRHQDKALSLAYRTLGHWELAEDISQEAFLRVYYSAERYRPEAKFTTWFYRIIINLCLDARTTRFNICWYGWVYPAINQFFKG